MAGQTIYAPAALNGYSAGQAVKLALRPELFSPDSTETVGENCLNGIVENVVFLGAIVRVHVRVGTSLLLMDEFNNPNLAVPEIGSTIQLYFRRENCLMLSTVEVGAQAILRYDGAMAAAQCLSYPLLIHPLNAARRLFSRAATARPRNCAALSTIPTPPWPAWQSSL